MARNCPVCDNDMSSKEQASITINNSESQYFSRSSNGICELDVVFDVNFPNNDGVSSVDICNECYKSNDHLTEEYITEHMD